MGGPDMAPHAPQRSERPGQAVTLLYLLAARGPDMAPHAPQRSERPGQAVTLLYLLAARGPRHGPPWPPAFGASQPSRDAPLPPRGQGAPTWPPNVQPAGLSA